MDFWVIVGLFEEKLTCLRLLQLNYQKEQQRVANVNHV